MKLYRVITSQLIYHECYIEAESEDDASDIAREDQGDLDWKEFQYGDWEIEDVQFQTKASYSSEENKSCN